MKGQGESLVEVISRYALKGDGSVEGRKRVVVFQPLGPSSLKRGSAMAAYDFDLSLKVSAGQHPSQTAFRGMDDAGIFSCWPAACVNFVGAVVCTATILMRCA